MFTFRRFVITSILLYFLGIPTAFTLFFIGEAVAQARHGIALLCFFLLVFLAVVSVIIGSKIYRYLSDRAIEVDLKHPVVLPILGFAIAFIFALAAGFCAGIAST